MESSYRSILLVDDDPDDVTLMKSALEEVHFGNPIVVAEDGEEALDYLYHRGRYASLINNLPYLSFSTLKCL